MSVMESWPKQFEAMREQFLARSGARLDEMHKLLQEARFEAEPEKLAELRRHFHWLAGAGGTYKLPEVSAFGSDGQDLCDALLQNNALPNQQDLEKLRGLLKQVRERFAAAGTT